MIHLRYEPIQEGFGFFQAVEKRQAHGVGCCFGRTEFEHADLKRLSDPLKASRASL